MVNFSHKQHPRNNARIYALSGSIVLGTLVSLASVFLSCNSNNNKTGNTAISDSLLLRAKLTGNERKDLVVALNDLRVAFESRDAERISNYFRFPLADEAILAAGIDSVLDQELVASKDSLSKAMFVKHFGAIYDYFELNQINELFNTLPIDSLMFKDEIEARKHFENRGCYYGYQVSIDGHQIGLIYGTNSNQDYAKKHPELEMVCAERSMFWIFLFDGKSLTFQKLEWAG